MDKGIYTALSGGIAKSHELELVANNLANANTPGFKKDEGTFNEYLTELRRQDSVEGLKREINAATMFEGRPPGDKSFVEMDGIYTNFSQGTMEKTSRSLDVGIEGNAFFEVLTPSGVRYTRQGNFTIDSSGRLVTVNGYPVLGSTGAEPTQNGTELNPLKGETITSAQGDLAAAQAANRFIVLGNGPVHITEDGVILQNDRRVATMAIQEFHEPQWLEKVGTSYFRNDHAENVMENTTAKLHQGYLEGSNVNPVSEMTKLIEVTRAYESHMQAIKTYQDIDGRSVNEIARER
jgi:flagellar basal-body rod protein FlgF